MVAKREDLCDLCESLTGKTPLPHKNLVHKENKSVNVPMGSVDDDYYACKTCGHEWLHEQGKLGYGWIF